MSVGIDFTFTQAQLRSLSKRLETLVSKAKNLRPFFDDASAYMENVVRNRIYRTKRSPDGAAWAPISQLTADLKGHNTILYHTGKLGRSIKTEMTDKSGFIIVADENIAPYAGYMQRGVARTGGKWAGKTIPARPFMGISEQNVKVISKMLKDHVSGRVGGASASDTGGFS